MNVPETSKEAYRSLRAEELRETYRKILSALSQLGQGTTEEIAAFLKMPHDRIWKRMSELERMELVYKPGTKRMMKSGRNGFTWMLRNPEKTENKLPPELNTYKQNESSAADHALNILQQSLF